MAEDTRTREEKAADLAAAKAAEAARVAEAKAQVVAEGRDPDERVMIRHSQVETLGGPVPRHTIVTTWAERGWSEAGENEE
jgi:hypothetical protein